MSFLHRHKFIFGIIVTVGVIVYIAFNLWVYRSATGGNTPLRKEVWQKVTKSGAGFQTVTGLNPATPFSSPPAEQDPAPRDTPRPTGPGSYACSPEGTCNVYNDETRKQFCTTTYADNRCLDQCGEKEKQCKK